MTEILAVDILVRVAILIVPDVLTVALNRGHPVITPMDRQSTIGLVPESVRGRLRFYRLGFELLQHIERIHTAEGLSPPAIEEEPDGNLVGIPQPLVNSLHLIVVQTERRGIDQHAGKDQSA